MLVCLDSKPALTFTHFDSPCRPSLPLCINFLFLFLFLILIQPFAGSRLPDQNIIACCTGASSSIATPDRPVKAAGIFILPLQVGAICQPLKVGLSCRFISFPSRQTLTLKCHFFARQILIDSCKNCKLFLSILPFTPTFAQHELEPTKFDCKLIITNYSNAYSLLLLTCSTQC